MENRQGRPVSYERKTTTAYRKERYVDGNTVKDLDVVAAIQAVPKTRIETLPEKKTKKAFHMNLGYVIFLVVALCVAGVVLIQYVKLQSEMTTTIKSIAQLESDLNNIKLDNEDAYTRILSSINLDEVNQIARQELGMVNPTSEQVIIVVSEGNDYVTQMAPIPSE